MREMLSLPMQLLNDGTNGAVEGLGRGAALSATSEIF